MLNTGAVLQNRYRIAALLGQGGMGAVYRAWHLTLNMPLALKEMGPQPGLDAATLSQLRQQFQQEAAILARLSHPSLVRVIDHFEEGGSVYLVMDFVEGESLAGRIGREGSLSEDRVLAWAEQLLDALDYCHGQGVIHRDIKPQNVIVRPDGPAVLVDFGLVKLWDPSDPQTRTVLRGMGTPEYAPPEQYSSQPGHTGPHSDVYSLGATLYHALTGQAPPPAADRTVDPATLRPLRALKPAISTEVEDAILTALELQPARRFGSAAEMQAALERTPAVAPPAPQPVKPQPAPRTPPVYKPQPAPKRQPTKVMAGTGAAAPAFPWHVPGWVWVAGGMAALVLLAVGVAAIWPKPPPETPEPTKEPPGPALGDSRTRPADGMDMVYVPAGQFQMGSTTEGFDNEQPVHTVALDGFWIDQAEVTNEQYARCVEVGGCEPLAASSVYAPGRYKALARAPVVRAEAVFTTTVPISPTVVSPPTGVVGPVATLALRTDTPEPTATITPTSTPMPTLSITPTGPIPTNTPVPTHPAVYVTWYQAAAYCEWAGGRLPTEAEWEYAARGPQGYVYPWGYDAPDCDRAKYRGCVGNTVAVGSYPTGESWCGALDMAGNVWEWVADWYGPYPSGWQENPKGPASGDSRVLRGGSWRDFREVAHSSFRFRDAPDSSYPSYGFRCVVDADQSD